MTGFPDTLDPARAIDATTLYDQAYMRSVDDQIRALGGAIVAQRSQSYAACRVVADPDGDALPQGCAVAIKPGAPVLLMQPATAANVAAGAVPFGVLTETTPPGARGSVAVAGAVPPSVTGLAASGSARAARANATTAMPEAVTSLSSGDIGLGIVTTDGTLVLQTTPSPGAGGPSAPRFLEPTFAASPSNIDLSPSDALADVLFLSGAPGDDLHTIRYPSAGPGFTPRPNGTRLLLANLTSNLIRLTDPWGNVGEVMAGVLYEGLWMPSMKALLPFLTGPNISRALDASFGTTRGTMLVRSSSGWAALAAPTGGVAKTLKHDAAGGDPYWG
jgi:hypothetical protein